MSWGRGTEFATVRRGRTTNEGILNPTGAGDDSTWR